MITLTFKCKKHPRYQGIYRPRVQCEACAVISLARLGTLNVYDMDRLKEQMRRSGDRPPGIIGKVVK
jgi:hypothetical protein